ncbi:hypothetical protein JK358_04750 [Nocardia sp. 2]|uniref:BON domain-containing protein n=1 Tax=Nocardia acididurans TaxID=2802282 RepID=A0ABS1LZJ8_9NOCA|nr:hypothetical protein [Nocardia acididurans]MBL1073694.1 hypothetical protein [Nocardia acididurans]
MRAVLAALVLAAALLGGVYGLAGSMKFHTDTGASGSRTTVTFDADVRTTVAEDPALTLWKECRSHVNHVRIVSGPVESAGRWTVVVEPALGTHTERRLIGCLRDLTVDGITGHDVDSRHSQG